MPDSAPPEQRHSPTPRHPSALAQGPPRASQPSSGHSPPAPWPGKPCGQHRSPGRGNSQGVQSTASSWHKWELRAGTVASPLWGPFPQPPPLRDGVAGDRPGLHPFPRHPADPLPALLGAAVPGGAGDLAAGPAHRRPAGAARLPVSAGARHPWGPPARPADLRPVVLPLRAPQQRGARQR